MWGGAVLSQSSSSWEHNLFNLLPSLVLPFKSWRFLLSWKVAAGEMLGLCPYRELSVVCCHQVVSNKSKIQACCKSQGRHLDETLTLWACSNSLAMPCYSRVLHSLCVLCILSKHFLCSSTWPHETAAMFPNRSGCSPVVTAATPEWLALTNELVGIGDWATGLLVLCLCSWLSVRLAAKWCYHLVSWSVGVFSLSFEVSGTEGFCATQKTSLKASATVFVSTEHR